MINWSNIITLVNDNKQYNGDVTNVLSKIINNYELNDYKIISDFFEDNEKIKLDFFPQEINNDEWEFIKQQNNKLTQITCIKNSNEKFTILYGGYDFWIMVYQKENKYLVVFDDRHLYILNNTHYLYKTDGSYCYPLELDNIMNTSDLFEYMKKELNEIINMFNYQGTTSEDD